MYEGLTKVLSKPDGADTDQILQRKLLVSKHFDWLEIFQAAYALNEVNINSFSKFPLLNGCTVSASSESPEVNLINVLRA